MRAASPTGPSRPEWAARRHTAGPLFARLWGHVHVLTLVGMSADLDPRDLNEVRRRVVEPVVASLIGPDEVSDVHVYAENDEVYVRVVARAELVTWCLLGTLGSEPWDALEMARTRPRVRPRASRPPRHDDRPLASTGRAAMRSVWSLTLSTRCQTRSRARAAPVLLRPSCAAASPGEIFAARWEIDNGGVLT